MATSQKSSHNERLPEITVKAVILGVVLSIVMAAANAYLGLFAGMTVCASIPAAVISMGVVRFFKRSNIFENNLVQTAASAGESLAAGVIFTLPALVMMGYWKTFNYLEIIFISGIGGLLGVLFTVPLRRLFIIEENLKYPEGHATAEVLQAGQASRDKSGGVGEDGLKLLGFSSLVGGLMKLAQQGFRIWPPALEGAFSFSGAIFGVGIDLSPALVSVGMIAGRNVSILVLAGGVISWLLAIPAYTLFSNGTFYADIDTVYMIWSTRVRYLGVGTMVIGGIYSICQMIPPVVRGIKSAVRTGRESMAERRKDRTEADIPFKWVATIVLISVLPVMFYYLKLLNSIWVALLITTVTLIFGFLFSSIAAFMAGVVGSSNNPISGITIAAILFTSLLLRGILGPGDIQGAAGAVIVGAIVCCAAAIAGDNMQDLKAGHIIRATPWKQQVMQIIGTISAALTLGITLNVLNAAYTIGSETLSAPQATLMKSISEGVFRGDVPWKFLIIGAVIGIIILMIDQIQRIRGSGFRTPVLAVAVGIYLPISLAAAIFLGGIISYMAEWRGLAEKERRKSLLFASGLITGEAIMGIIIAVPVFITARPDWWPKVYGLDWLGILTFAAVVAWLFKLAVSREERQN